MSSRIIRWQELLSQFNIVWFYRKGSEQLVSDALSRKHLMTLQDMGQGQSTLDLIQQGYGGDEKMDEIIKNIRAGQTEEGYRYDGHFLYKVKSHKRPTAKWKRQPDQDPICVPDGPVRLSLLKEFHSTKSAAHLAMGRQYDNLKREFHWPGMYKDLKEFNNYCQECQRGKQTHRKRQGKLMPLSPPTKRWQQIAMDFIVGLPKSGGFDQILVVIDMLTKFTILVPTKSTDSSEDTARRYYSNIFNRIGLPETILTDKDPKFTSAMWQELFRLLGTDLKYAAAFHPQTDGACERMIQTVSQAVRMFTETDSHPWHHDLGVIEFAINTTKNAASGENVFFISQGRDPKSPALLISAAARTAGTTPKKTEKIARQLEEEIRGKLQGMRRTLLEQQEKMKTRYDKTVAPSTEYKVGQEVYVRSGRLCTPIEREKHKPKMRSKWTGPYKIHSKINDNAYKVELPDRLRHHTVMNINDIKAFKFTTRFGDKKRPPPLWKESKGEGDYYELDKIIDMKKKRGKTMYLSRWKGYGKDADTWEPEQNFTLCPEEIQEFLMRRGQDKKI